MKDGEMRTFDDIRGVAEAGLRDAQLFLHSPRARKARAVVAAGLIVAAPAIARHPYLRSTKLLRVIGVTGGAALIVKAAEIIRDWEPGAAATTDR
jgi:hypothetical protein